MSLILLGILNSQVTAAGGAAYDLLETQVLSSSAASVTFTGLGSYSDYKHLQIRAVARNTFTGFNGNRNIRVRFNGDSGTNYAWHRLYGDGSSVTSDAVTGSNYASASFFVPDNDATANAFGAGVIDILDFSSAAKNTTIRTLSGTDVSASPRISLNSALWLNTNAVTSIELSSSVNDLVAGSRFSLYGVKA